MNPSENIKIPENPEPEPKSDKIKQDLRSGGLNYIHQQNRLVLIPVIFGIFTLIVQGFNIFFVIGMGGFNRPPPVPDGPVIPGDTHPPPPFDLATPAIIFLIFAIFLLIKVFFLIYLRKMTYAFEHKTKRILPAKLEYPSVSESESDSPESNDLTMTKVFYTIIDHMNLIQKLSICLYLVFILYLQWYIRYFIDLFGLFPAALSSFENIMHMLNFINQIGLLFYLIFDIYQYAHWYKKLQKIQVFERSISQEFDGL